jgi:hypothetical protein
MKEQFEAKLRLIYEKENWKQFLNNQNIIKNIHYLFK